MGVNTRLSAIIIEQDEGTSAFASVFTVGNGQRNAGVYF